MDDVLASYATGVTPELIAGYDALPSVEIYASVLDLFPDAPARVADIGAGTGRDAAWLARQGHRVLAVEPVRAFREAGARLHGEAVEWLDDRLPELEALQRYEPFDLVLLCAVWHHLDTPDRERAIRSLARITASGGRLVLSLRHDPAPERHSFPAPPEEAVGLAKAAGFRLTRQADADSVHAQSRARGVRWTWLVLTRDAPS
jgi:SAM-dependent methyltransferase